MSSCKLHQAVLIQIIGLKSILTLGPFSQLQKADTGEGPKQKKPRKWGKEARWEMGMAILVSLMPTLTFTNKHRIRAGPKQVKKTEQQL